MHVTHCFEGVKSRGPVIEISRGSDGFMLAAALTPSTAKLLGPFPNAIMAEKAGIAMAQERGVEALTVVCRWLNPGNS